MCTRRYPGFWMLHTATFYKSQTSISTLQDLTTGCDAILRVYIGIMEKKMETTIMGYIGFRVMLGLLLGLYWGPPSYGNSHKDTLAGTCRLVQDFRINLPYMA